MDVHCSTCGEPWDVDHLRHDAIFETDLSHEEAETWRELSPGLRLSPRYREKFKAVGWEFALRFSMGCVAPVVASGEGGLITPSREG